MPQDAVDNARIWEQGETGEASEEIQGGMRVSPNDCSPASAKPLFSFHLKLGGELQMSDVSVPTSPQQISELLSEWFRKNPTALVELEERYRRIKAVGKRLMKKRE